MRAVFMPICDRKCTTVCNCLQCLCNMLHLETALNSADRYNVVLSFTLEKHTIDFGNEINNYIAKRKQENSNKQTKQNVHKIKEAFLFIQKFEL